MQNTTKKMRHSLAHILAAASTQLRPETKLGVGPSIDNGFYHDIDVDEHYTDSDLKKLEQEMRKIKNMDLPIEQREISKDEARSLFANDQYKLELIDRIEGDTVGISDMGDGFFVTLCEGGHVESTGQVGFFKLTHLAGVYWQGDEKNNQLQRIYGVAFDSEKELAEYLDLLEEAKKRDHRKLGKQLDLFTFSPLVGSGLPLFTPRGTIIREELQKFIYEIQDEYGYERVSIPHLAKPALYKTSGHWDKFVDDIFHVRGKNDNEFVIKPMNCPHHTQIFASKQRSYKELPLRFAEITQVYRDEQQGELQGLSRVRSITQDDGHAFCSPDQIRQEIDVIMSIIEKFYTPFDFKLSFRLSLRDIKTPEKYLDSDMWNEAESSLRDVLKDKNIDFTEKKGEAAFYGPKIDFVALDSLKRKWQLATIQLDFNMPKRFELKYRDKDGSEKTPVMIHRAISGSFERFMTILLEHYAGQLPLWLSPVQVAILPITSDQNEYADTVKEKLKKAGIRVSVDDRSESIGKKIREAEKMKTPIMFIVGKKEADDKTVSIRSRINKNEGAQDTDAVVSNLKQAVIERDDSIIA